MKSADKHHRNGSMRDSRATIMDVARDAGVSKTSVSRYLSGEFKVLSDDIRQRIEASIARLGYRPSQMARGLKGGRTRLIGLVVADVMNPYSVAILHGAEAVCQQHGYTLMLCNTGNDEAREKQALTMLRSYDVEGLIVHSQGRPSRFMYDLLESNLPVVLVDRRVSGIEVDLVGLDNRQAGRAATVHLIERGFTDILYVTQPIRAVSSREERHTAFLETLAARPDCRGETLELAALEGDAALDHALAAFMSRAGTQRKALLAASGVVTLQLVLALRRLGLTVPQQVGLLGFDELSWSKLVEPGISTLAQPTDEIGFQAATRLLERIATPGHDHHELLLPGTLIVRGSTSA
ncbi:transcriptional regulator, LacI family [Pseudogulbenkiania ferrooxidans 2002]|uniref:Transcriptional regulator, LacI family n=2 Tax=Pseudogulbenkiania ferrooxidans TaxID=549169 RepID=B9Z7V1_9NEIS|nr:transcriptional regulator, LacI family [Pseudogulbenkiania ferrooxidans 2002]